MKSLIECPYCKGKMKKSSKGRGNIMGILCALMMFFLGVIVFIAIPVIGWVVGGIMCIYALTMGGNKKSFWKCTECSSTIERS